MDYRFYWLCNEFLQYFQNWLQSIEDRPGNFTANTKQKMFISWQTYQGIKITTLSVIEVVQYLLSNNVPYVLTERFCQDPLENYFGRQRSMGARKDNPSIRNFGYIMTTASGTKRFSGQSIMGILLITPTLKSMMNQFPAEKEKESESKKTAIFIATHIKKSLFF